jgi:hypothetical protein
MNKSCKQLSFPVAHHHSFWRAHHDFAIEESYAYAYDLWDQDNTMG